MFLNHAINTSAAAPHWMSLPDAQHAIYLRNPLREVICKLDFPAILAIDSDTTKLALFQEGIRKEFPLFEDIPLSSALPPDLPPQIRRLISLPGGQVQRRFSTPDRRWSVDLTREYIALSCRQSYERWASFREHLHTPLTSFEQVFRPAFYSRLGLRYQNVIRRSVFGVKDLGWAELLQPHIAAEFSSADISGSITSSAHQVSFKLEQWGGVTQVRHGLSKFSNEPSYTLDFDFFTTQQTELNNAGPVLDYFNEQARRLFRWCITDRLHDALGPKPA